MLPYFGLYRYLRQHAKHLLALILSTTCIGLTGCIESDVLVSVSPDRRAQIEIKTYQPPQNTFTMRAILAALRAPSASIDQRSTWDSLASSMGRGVSLDTLSITNPERGGTQVTALYNVEDVRLLQIGMTQAAPLLHSMKLAPAAWNYRFTWVEKERPQLRIIPPRPRPQAGIVSPKEALGELGSASLGEQSLAALLRGARISMRVEAVNGLHHSNAVKYPRVSDNEVLLIKVDMLQLTQAGAWPTVFGLKDYEGIQRLYTYVPKALFMQDPSINILMELVP